MDDLDETPLHMHQRYRELPYDREVRNRRPVGCVPALLAAIILVLAGLAFYWLVR